MEVEERRPNISCQENLFTTLNAIEMAMDKKVMKQTVDFDECLKDSPRFRLQIEQSEHDISTLESLLEKVNKQCNIMVESGKTFNNSTSGLMSALESLVKYFDEDIVVKQSLRKFQDVLGELKTYLSMLLDQTQRSVTSTLHQFVKKDIKKVKDTKKLFDKISDDLDNAFNKHAALPRNCKSQEEEEDKNILTAMQSCFDHISLDYAFQINVLQSRKRIEVLDTISKLLHSNSSYFHQGQDLMNDLESYRKKLNHELEGLSIQFMVDKKEMEERHTLVQKRDASQKLEKVPDHPGDVVIEGYLFKRSSNAFKTWQRRYFVVQNNQLLYQKRSKDEQTVLAEDLRLCNVKANDEMERRFCFDIVLPTKVWCLQADSDLIRDDWINTLQASINKAFSTAPVDSESDDEMLKPSKKSKSLESLDNIAPPQSILSAVRSLPGNETCADCGHPDPKWASINLGIVLCIECSGIHRSLGVHVSKVRSLTLDAWEPEHLKLMSELGNALINSIFEAKPEAGKKKINQTSNRNDREAYIKAKYVQHKFVSLDAFLRTCNRLDGSIIKNLARMKGYHDQKNAANKASHVGIERSDSAVNKLLKMTHGLKKSFNKADKLERKRSSSADSSVDDHFSSGSNESPKIDPRKRSESKSSDKKQKGILRTISKGKKDIDSLLHRRKSCDGGLEDDNYSKKNGKTYNTKASSSKNVEVTERIDLDVPTENLDEIHVDAFESDPKERVQAIDLKLPMLADSDLMSSQESNSSLSAPLARAEGSISEDMESGRDSPRTWATKVLAEHSLVEDDDHRTKSESTDSVLSDEGIASVSSEDNQGVQSPEDDGEDASYRDDLEKAIEVLKNLHPNRLLYKAAEWKSIPLMVAAFAEGAKANWVNEDDDCKLVLHQSVLGGSLTASEYLLQNGAKINQKDCRGRSALHYAALLGQTGQACLFLKRGANQHAVDENGEDPLTIALKQTNADIVTLLRIARLNEEMRESEDFTYGSAGDVTFTDVFRDFSNMASTNPDILRRNFGAPTNSEADDPERQTSL